MDWRATARRRKLTVRAHQVNQSQRLIFLIDCGRMMAGDTGGGLSPLDHAFNAMLMLAHVALIRGDQVGLLAFSDRDPGLRPARRRPAADQPAGPQRPQRLPRAGRAPLRPGVRRAGEAVPEAVAGRPDDEPVRRRERRRSSPTTWATSSAGTCRWASSSATTTSSPWPTTPPTTAPASTGAPPPPSLLDLARARPRRPPAPGRPDPRRLPRRPDRPADQPVPPDQGPAPALTRAQGRDPTPDGPRPRPTAFTRAAGGTTTRRTGGSSATSARGRAASRRATAASASSGRTSAARWC